MHFGASILLFWSGLLHCLWVLIFCPRVAQRMILYDYGIISRRFVATPMIHRQKEDLILLQIICEVCHGYRNMKDCIYQGMSTVVPICN